MCCKNDSRFNAFFGTEFCTDCHVALDQNLIKPERQVFLHGRIFVMSTQPLWLKRFRFCKEIGVPLLAYKIH